MNIEYTNENFEDHWGFVDFNEKTVLDIGADFGSTAKCFLHYGAKKVIACEGDDLLYIKLTENFKDNEKVSTIKKFINCSKDLEYLILSNCIENKLDVVKIDIEAYEKFLFGVSSYVINKVKEYIIECHSNEIRDDLVKKFENSGFTILKTVNLSVPGFSVIYAVRKFRNLSFVTMVTKDELYKENVINSTYENRNNIEYITVKNSESGASGLNTGVNIANNDIIICCHQDVYFEKGWYEKFNECLDKLDDVKKYGIWGILGFAGTTYDGKMVGTHSGLGMTEDITKVQTLDESVLILKKSNNFKFDKGLIYFHMYGTDISLQSYDKNLNVYTLNVPIEHRTKWTSGHGLIESCTYIVKKWKYKYKIIYTTVGTLE